MENEKKSDRQMCDWCGNEYGRKYKWWRLILAILIGLFIFMAGIEIGQMRAQVYGSYGMRGHMMHQGGYMMGGQYGQDGTTTIVVPANPTSPTGTTSVNPGGPMIPATSTPAQQ